MTIRFPSRAMAAALVVGLWFDFWPSEARGSEDKPSDNEVKFAPSSLFRGELARLEPHLDLTAHGCVKVDFAGDKEMTLELVIWRNGKSRSFGEGEEWPMRAGEVSISVREVKDDGGKKKYRVTIAKGGSVRRRDIDPPALKDDGETVSRGTRTRGLREPVRVKEGTPVAVWIFRTWKGKDEFKEEAIEEEAKHAEWALVLRVGVRKWK